MATSNGNRNSRLPHDRVPSTVPEEEPVHEPEPPKPSPTPGARQRRMRMLSIGIPAVLGLIGVFLLGLWVLGDRSPVDVALRDGETAAGGPDAEGPGAAMMGEDQPVPGDMDFPGGPGETAEGQPGMPGEPGGFGGTVAAAGDAPATSGGGSGGSAWPNFRGPGYDAIAQDASGLASSWPSGGPRKVWTAKMLGPGHAGAAIADGRVYVLDYDKGSRQDVLRCLSLSDGKEIWRQSYAVDIKDNHGISRTVPAVADGYVVALGPMGHVTCARADSGEVVWQVDLKKVYGTKIPSWYAGQCPIIDEGRAILAPGGKALMIAVDCATGSVAWEARNANGWQMTHSSVTPIQLGGRKVYVYTASGGIAGVAASDGSIVFEYPGWSVNTANVPTPVPVGNDRLFVTGGYGAGSILLSVKGGTPTQAWKIPQNVFGSHQHTPVFYQNHLFGVAMDKQLVCLDLSGKRVWSSGHTATFGIGPYMLADGKFYVLGDDGTLVMAQASTSGYNELARAKVLPGPDAWAPMALSGGKLVLRDRDTMICLDVANP